ncbi:MAG: tetratricopeptide repeat protein, partial [Bacteroidaceae bacterium]|nr:tetratricopeptide repeat protein [Bacteroidaceae bacterium]
MQRYITFVISLLVCCVAWSQSNERDFIRMGNKYFRSGQYQKAETYYRKSIDKKPTMEGYYNLGNALAFQEQDSTAFEMYKKAVAEPSDNALKKSHIYHNMGNLTYVSGLREMNTGGQNASQSFQQAVDLYKSALRLNPNDNETRYNLAMAQHQLKKSQQGGGGNNDKNKDQDKQKQEQKQQQQQQIA